MLVGRWLTYLQYCLNQEYTAKIPQSEFDRYGAKQALKGVKVTLGNGFFFTVSDNISNGYNWIKLLIMHLCILGKPGVTTSVLFERRKPLASISIEGVVGASRNLDIMFPRFDKEDRKYFKINTYISYSTYNGVKHLES